VKHVKPNVYLPMADGTHAVFCEVSYRRVRPCDGRVIFSSEGELIRDTVLYDANKAPLYFCGHHCIAWYVKGA